LDNSSKFSQRTGNYFVLQNLLNEFFSFNLSQCSSCLIFVFSSTLDHPNIVKCLGGCTTASDLCIVTGTYSDFKFRNDLSFNVWFVLLSDFSLSHYTLIWCDLEYCNGGSLYTLLHNQKVKLSTKQQLEYASEIAEGMEYLHSREPMIVHRDLKSENILVKNEFIIIKI
jgi:serine/threonine protein kinase